MGSGSSKKTIPNGAAKKADHDKTTSSTKSGAKKADASSKPAQPTKKEVNKSGASKKTAPVKKSKGPGDLEHKLALSGAALKEQFGKVQTVLRKLRGEGTVSFDALWELVDKVLTSDPPLYLGGGYKTKEAFIAAELPGETSRSVQRNVLVARCFSPEEEAQYGIAFLEEVALYARDLTAAEQPPPAIHLDKLTIALPGKGGAPVRKKASAATIDDVRVARRALRKTAPKKTGNPIDKALHAAFAGEKSLAAVTVRTTAAHATFANVPLGELSTFAHALSKAKLPKQEG